MTNVASFVIRLVWVRRYAVINCSGQSEPSQISFAWIANKKKEHRRHFSGVLDISLLGKRMNG